tara:strand:- start:29461 stop:31881 length:2421 start_codon:yes stop_codon:yes gene_type:complete
VFATISVSILCLIPASAQPINEDFKLVASDASTNDQFGWSIAYSGNTVLIGAPGNEEYTGAAYLLNATTGEQLFKLTADDAQIGDKFGVSVSISGNTAIIGADGIAFGSMSQGAAYLFDVTTGEQLIKLTADDGEIGDAFGVSVSISGTTAIVGAKNDDGTRLDSGSAYLFDTTTGQQLSKIISPLAIQGNSFGRNVAISGTIAIVGAGQNKNGETLAGSAYRFDTTTGNLISELIPDSSEGGDVFGSSIAISGTTAIIGAYGDENAGNSSGAAYLFDIVTGRQIAKLIPRFAGGYDYFGRYVAISESMALVGAVGNNDTGSAYVFDLSNFHEIAKLKSSDAALDDNFGRSVAISGNNAIVGALFDDDAGNSSGSAYMFSDIEAPCEPYLTNETLKLAPNGDPREWNFGYSIDISGNTAVVGATKPNDIGSAYLFDTETGTQLARLTAEDASPGDAFGVSVAISPSTVIVGATNDEHENGITGSAYLFDVITGAQIGKLISENPTTGDGFGSRVAIYGNTAIVGAHFDSQEGFRTGAVYIFDIATGLQVAKFTGNDSEEEDYFGTAVAIWGDTVIVGATSNGDAGAAYLFDAVTGEQLFKLNSNDAGTIESFGRSVSISGTTAIVGAPRHNNNGADAGAAYLFDTTTGEQIAKITAAENERYDNFGQAVDITETTAIIGASYDHEAGFRSGSAYLFDLETELQIAKLVGSDTYAPVFFGGNLGISGNNIIVHSTNSGLNNYSVFLFKTPNQCMADLNDDGIVNFYDLSLFMIYFQSGNPIVDFSCDGLFNFFDLSVFLNEYFNRCQ